MSDRVRILGYALAVLGCLGGAWIFYGEGAALEGTPRIIAQFIFGAACVGGGAIIAANKGFSPWAGFAGVLGPIGIVVLVMLPKGSTSVEGVKRAMRSGTGDPTPEETDPSPEAPAPPHR